MASYTEEEGGRGGDGLVDRWWEWGISGVDGLFLLVSLLFFWVRGREGRKGCSVSRKGGRKKRE